MEPKEKTKITVETIVNVPVEKAWQMWTNPDDVIKWNNASDDWCTPRAQNDLRKGGSFVYRMESTDGKMGFDFGGTYDEVINHKQIAYTMGDGRVVSVAFTGNGNQTKIVETFDAESANSIEMQRGGWQNILDNFKKHAEAQN